MKYDGYVRADGLALAVGLFTGVLWAGGLMVGGLIGTSQPIVFSGAGASAALKAIGGWPVAEGMAFFGLVVGYAVSLPFCGYKMAGGWWHARGRKLAPPPAGAKVAKLYYKKMANRPGNASRLSLAPGVPFPFESEVMGILALGAPGAGKSQILEWLLASWLARGDTRLIVLDAGKGDFTSKWPTDNFYLLAPHDDRVQPGGGGPQAMAWDIASDCTSFQDAAEFAERVILESKEPHWADGARLIFQGIIVGLQRTRGRNWGWADLHAAVIQPDASLNQWMQNFFPEALSYVALEANGTKADKNAKSYINNFRATAIKMTKPLALAWGNTPAALRLSIRKWVLAGGKSGMAPTIILGRTGQFSSMSAAWIGSLLRLLNGLVNSPALTESKTRRIILCLDELRTIAAPGDPLRQFVETGRSKGCGLVAALQTIEQVSGDDVWGPVAAKGFLAVMQTKILGKIMATTDQSSGANAIAENLVGYQEVERWAPKHGKGDRTRDKEKRLVVLPNFFEYAVGAFEKSARAALLLPQHLALIEWPYSQWKPVRPPVIAARWIETAVSSLSPIEIELLASEMSPDQQRRLKTVERDQVLREALGITFRDPALEDEEPSIRRRRQWPRIAAGVAIVLALIGGPVAYLTRPLSVGDTAVVIAPAAEFSPATGQALGKTASVGATITIRKIVSDAALVKIADGGMVYTVTVEIKTLRRQLPWGG